jgi:MFS family permease
MTDVPAAGDAASLERPVAQAQAAEDPPAIAPVSAGYRRYALGLLLVIYTLNFLDRQILNILMEDIKAEFHLLDWQLGLLGGLAFAALYTTMGIPIARLAERSNRPLIISASVAAWSVFTALCGAAANFWQLLLYRVGVGLGEAGCSPPAHSLISDYVPKEMRASAIAFYSIGTPLGTVAGLIIGGYMVDHFDWRTAFLVAGAPGLLVALIAAFTLVEPRKKLKADLKARAELGGPTFIDALKILKSKKTFWLIAFAASIKAFIGYGHAPFSISFFLREHGPEIKAIAASLEMGERTFLGLALSGAGGVAGIIGAWFGGWISDKLGKKDIRAYVLVPAVASVITVPIYILGVSVDAVMAAIIILAVPAFLGTLWYGPVYASAQSLVPLHTRATAAAVILFTINLIGLGLGPLAVGLISDGVATLHFAPAALGDFATICPGGSAPKGAEAALKLACADSSAEGIRWALILSTLFGLVAALLFWLARKTIREEMVS